MKTYKTVLMSIFAPRSLSTRISGIETLLCFAAAKFNVSDLT